MNQRNLFGAMIILIVAGCAQLAKRPDSPAAQKTALEFEMEPKPPGERYYMIVFGSQSVPLRPKYTHTWATAVRVVDQGPDTAPLIDHYTISWMPATLDIRPWRFSVEPGTNLDLHQSIQE